MEDRTLLATMLWSNAAGGDWDTASNWVNSVNSSDHHVPTTSDDAQINLTGITVTHTSSTSDSVNSVTVASGVTLSLSSGKLSIAAASTNSGTLAIGAATLAGAGTLTNAGSLTISGGTIAAPLVNQGTIVVPASTTTVSGAFSNAAGATIEIQGNGQYGSAALSATAGLSNSGTIDLTTTYDGYGETLTVTGGALVNASGGTISTSAGTGGPRTITAQLDNQAGATLLINEGTTLNSSGASSNEGTITVNAGLTISQSGTSPSFTNTGSVTDAAGQALTFNSGTVDQNGGTIGGAGALALNSLTLTLGASFSTATMAVNLYSTTVNGPGTLTNAAGKTLTLTYGTVNAPLVNQGTIVVPASTATVSGAFGNAAGATIEIQGNGQYGSAALNATAGLSNSGTIDLTSALGYSEALTVTGGTLVNVSGGIISASAPGGGGRTITAQLDNQAGATLLINEGTTLNSTGAASNEGTITVNAGLTVSQSGSSPSFTNTGAISIASGQTLAVNSGTVNQNAGSISGAGSLALNNLTFDLGASFSTASAGLSLYSTTVNGPGTLTNAAGKTLTLTYATVNAPLVNQGTIVVPASTTTVSGAFSNAAGATIEIQGNGQYGSAALSATAGLSNSGTIDLTSALGYSEALTVTGGTLVNASGGIISASAPGGGGRTITAQLDNQAGATLLINEGTTLNSTGAASNEGTITVNAGLTVSQSGTNPSFTNTGTISIASGQTLAVSGGVLGNFQNGTLTAGTYQISGT
jgi:filamentous hemagglutinin